MNPPPSILPSSYPPCVIVSCFSCIILHVLLFKPHAHQEPYTNLFCIIHNIVIALKISVWAMFFISFKMASKAQRAYSDASNVVQQIVGSIRTVASFTREKQVVANYKKLLATVYKSEKVVGLSTGLGTDFFLFTMLSCYALAVWFSAKLILHIGYTGGDVFTVLLAVEVGSFSLGQASAPMNAFSSGRAAVFKMFETIHWKLNIDAYDPKGNKLNDICEDIEFRGVFQLSCKAKRENLQRIFYNYSQRHDCDFGWTAWKWQVYY